MKREQNNLKRQDLCKDQMKYSLRNLIVDMKERPDNSVVKPTTNTREGEPSMKRLHSVQLRNEADIIKGGIYRRFCKADLSIN